MILLKPTMALKIIAAALLLTAGESTSYRISQLRGKFRIGSRTESDRDRYRASTFMARGIAEGVEREDLPCLMAAICDQPELSILCGFTTTYLGEWNATASSGSPNFFVEEGEGTFFAPLDIAFVDSSGNFPLSTISQNDLMDGAILENVLSYHVAPIYGTPNTTEDLLYSLEDFECDRKLVMANGQTTETVCIDENKYQVGNGNKHLKTMPKITQKGIEACDGTVVMHFVDQLIMPNPLVPEDPALVSAHAQEVVGCPFERPELNESCQDPGETCSYGHTYDGCSWGELQCIPKMDCICGDIEETGIDRWMCFLVPLRVCPPVVAIASASARASEIETSTAVASKESLAFGGLPRGRCEPNDPLPTQPSSSECPNDAPDFNGSCEWYTGDDSCNYGHIYTGCSWDNLRCTSIETCSCRSGTWKCAMMGMAPCGEYTDDGFIPSILPEGLPRGVSCVPDEELPTASPSVVCPNDTPLSFQTSCEGYPAGTRCEFDHVYTGCSWEDLSCSRNKSCDCDENSGTWACTEMSISRCGDYTEDSVFVESILPEGLPRWDSCDPNEPLPSAPTPVQSVQCPIVTPESYITSCEEYPMGTLCEYDHLFMGCSWGDLGCSWTTRCWCDEGRNWACDSKDMDRCGYNTEDGEFVEEIFIEGLPRGKSCDPDEDLPTPHSQLSDEADVDGNSNVNVDGKTDLNEADVVEGDVDEDEIVVGGSQCPNEGPNPGGSCADFDSGLVCKYNYMYMGCTWETLRCSPIMRCTCGKYGGDAWLCSSSAMMNCEEKPEDHPFGKVCESTNALPTAATASAVTAEARNGVALIKDSMP